MELTLDEALKQGIEAHKAGQIHEAERLYTAILKAQPNHPDANHNMGVLAVGVGKIQQALPFFKVALEAKPSVAQFWLSYINSLIKLDRIPDAKAVFDQAKDKGAKGDVFDQLEKRLSEFCVSESQSRDSDPSSEQLQPIMSLYTQGHLQQTLSEISQMLERFPNSVALYNIAGASNAGLKQFDAAIACFKQALKIKPDNADSYYNMGVSLMNKGDLEAAIESYKKALKIKPDNASAYYNMGIALKDKGDLDAAIKSYKKALKIKPDYAEAHNNLGITLQKLGRLDEAAIAFRTSHNHDPASHLSLFNLHSTYYRDMNLDFGAAIKCLVEAVQIAPTDSSVNFFLGMLLDYTGQEEKSKRYFSFVQEDMPDSYAQLDSWSWVKSNISQYPLLFWQKYDGFDYAFDAAQIDGLILEFGVAHGTSIRRLASKTDQFIHGFDSFKGLPESWAHLPKGAFNRDGYVPLAPDHVKFHVGLFDQTLPVFLIKNEDPIKFLNIDCDLYSSTKTIFDLIEGRIVSGTVIFFDEYLGFKDWRNHEFKAFQEAVKRNGWLYDYLAINISGYNAVVIIR